MAAGFNKRRLRQEIERERKRAVRERLAELRKQIKAARVARREALIVIRDQCKAERKAVTISCDLRRQQAREDARKAVEERRREIGGVHSEESIYREADNRQRKASVRSTARERRSEDDDAVRANLPIDLVPVFDKVRRVIKGGPRKSRTESFLEWAQDNPAEVLSMQSMAADRDVDRLVAEYEALQWEEEKRRRRAVPF